MEIKITVEYKGKHITATEKVGEGDSPRQKFRLAMIKAMEIAEAGLI